MVITMEVGGPVRCRAWNTHGNNYGGRRASEV